MKKRTIYFNDARHYYLFVFEPPMDLQDAWVPIDECAGTSVNTFVYGVSRADGLFYPSKTSMRFGEDIQPFQQNAYYRVWHNMKSLIDRGLDPLQVLIDRAHDKKMDFFASLRLGSYGGMDPSQSVLNGGRGWVNPEIRNKIFDILSELTLDYNTDGIELDFAAPPSGGPPCLQKEDVPEYTDVITEWVASVSQMAKDRTPNKAEIGARIYPTKELNINYGYDIDTWLSNGYIDYVTPMLYAHNVIDTNKPIEWLVDIAHKNNVSVYPILEPYYNREQRPHHTREWATPEMLRATVSNYWDMNVDGIYTYFLKWPLGNQEREILTELSDPDLILEKDKHYILDRATETSDSVGYETKLPIKIPRIHKPITKSLTFKLSDDFEKRNQRISSVILKIHIGELVSDDKLQILLNGNSLESEHCKRYSSNEISAYHGQWLEFNLANIQPIKGPNKLDISLISHPVDLVSTLVIEDIEVIVKYNYYPSKL